MKDILYALQDTERYVYHYTSPENLLSILESGELRLSPFKDVNDPREYKDWTFSYVAVVSTLGGPDEKQASDINSRLKHACRIACFSSDTVDALVTPRREDQGADIVHAGYHRGHSRPTLWWNYASRHAGACLVFDRQKLDLAIRATAAQSSCNIYSDRVMYSYPKVVMNFSKPHELKISKDALVASGLDVAIDAHLRTHWRGLFFVKAPDWQPEREYRWLVTDFHEDRMVAVVLDSLLCILLGERSCPATRKAVADFGSAHRNVMLAVLYWKNGYPQPTEMPWRLLSRWTG